MWHIMPKYKYEEAWDGSRQCIDFKETRPGFYGYNGYIRGKRVDSNGNDCEWYKTHEDKCGSYDTLHFESFMMCCACGEQRYR